MHFLMFLAKYLLFAQLCERNFGGNPLVGGPKLLHITSRPPNSSFSCLFGTKDTFR